MNKNSNTVLKAVIASVLVVWLMLSLVFGSFNPIDWSLVKDRNGEEGNAQDAVGVFEISVVGYDSLDITSSLTLGTNFNCYVFANRAGGWIMLGGFSGGTATIELTPQDYGYAYIVVEIPSGQSYYVDFATTKLQNPRVVSVLYDDPDGDGYKEFIFKVDMKNIPKPASGNPKIYFYPYFLAYQKPSLNSPADISGIGTAAVTKYIEWYVSFSSEKKAWALAKVEISINTTDTTKITLNRVNIPGVGYLTGDAFGTPVKGTNSLTWTYNTGSNLYEANYIKYGSNQLNKFEFTTQIECQLDAGDIIAITITLYGFTTTGTLETLTDTVVLAA